MPQSVEIKSDMDGTLAMFFAEDGAEVEEGENIAAVEIMKMFNDVLSPAKGTVKWLAKLGEIVETNQVLGHIEVQP